MTSMLQNLVRASWNAADLRGDLFTPVARYYPQMDFLLYLNEDVSYRADRVDPFLTVLWHPNEHRLVGLKLKGFKFLFERIKLVLDLRDEQFLPIVKVLEVALVGGIAEAIMDKTEQERISALYQRAREIAKDVPFSTEEMRLAA